MYSLLEHLLLSFSVNEVSVADVLASVSFFHRISISNRHLVFISIGQHCLRKWWAPSLEAFKRCFDVTLGGLV